MAEEEEKESPVKSTAVVKYSAVYSPITYSRLQCNTDLKQPPSNWYSSYGESFGLQHVIAHSSGFSSFQMAHMFPDCVGEVDVVSDAENIKKLLKIPYSSSPVSMVVHRIENTLLLDEFDLHSHLLNQSESDWEWMRKVFVEHFRQNMSRENMIVRKDAKSYQQSLVAKFLHYSLPSEEEMRREKEKEESTAVPQPKPLLAAKEWPCLPEPPAEKQSPDPASSRHTFARNVIWTFEDIQMLLGTDLPIFGGGTHPCLSLRLRDMKRPINVLTGIDYWLDNLMCNVPEVVMCYHLEGIVQRYELVKTEDLPDLAHSRFSPKLIRGVAQNILSFLKANATKAGHTYWLFKGRNEEVVKLYDLTSLCSEELVSAARNPFTVPVAMLLYRVARNMRQTRVSCGPASPASPPAAAAGTIRMLLKHCLSLLGGARDYPQLAASCHYMLADLYVPVATDPAAPDLDGQLPPEEEGEDVGDDQQALCRPPPLVKTLSERCKAALHHVSEGLQCLQYFPPNTPEEEAATAPPEPQFANPTEPIPMPYQTKKPPDATEQADTAKSLLCKKEEEAMPTWAQVPAATDSRAWKQHLQMLLYKKACLVYAALAENSYKEGRYGDALKYIEAVLDCRTHTGLPYTGALASYLLGRAGDCCFKAVQDWSRVDTHNADLARKLRTLGPGQSNGPSLYETECGMIPKQLASIKDTMLSSLACYERALSLAPSEASRGNLWPRLGNIYNELGSMAMNEAGLACQKEPPPLSQQEILDLFVKAEDFLGRGIAAFERARDDANLALLHSNMGRLCRLRAHAPTAARGACADERAHYGRALDHYTAALGVLARRKRSPPVWDTVTWELCTALYNLAVLAQEFPHYSSNKKVSDRSEMEREVVDLLQRALKYCDMDTPSPRQVVYQYRAATIHHRLASLYHNSYRVHAPSEAKRKLAALHYEKAAALLAALDNTEELLRVQLERVALAEFLGERATSVQGQIRHLQAALAVAAQCVPTLNLLAAERKEESSRCAERRSKFPSAGAEPKGKGGTSSSGAETDRKDKTPGGDASDKTPSSDKTPGGVSSDKTPGGVSSDKTPGGESSDKTPGGESSDKTPGGESSDKTPGGDSSDKTPGGDSSDKTPGGDASDKTPGGDSSDKTPGGDSSDKTPGGDSSDKTPGGESSDKTPGGDSSDKTPGGDSSDKTPGGDSSDKTPGRDSSDKTPGGDSSDKTPGGDSSDKTPGGDSSDKTPGRDSSDKTPGGDSSDKTPGGDSSDKTPGGDSSDKTPGRDSSDKTPGGDSSDKTPGGDSSDKTPGGESSDKTPGGDASDKTPAGDSSAENNSSDARQENGREHLVQFLEQRLQVILRRLTQLCLKHAASPRLAEMGARYKEAYARLLRGEGREREEHLSEVLASLERTGPR